MRLDRLLANSGYGSRTTVKTLIRSNKVSVDGSIITDSSFHINEKCLPDIVVSGVSIAPVKYLHYLMNKPKGYITAMDDSRHSTVSELFPPNILTTGIFPVGRLDKDTTGLLLFTNDGTLCHRLTGPHWHVDKVYYFELEGKYLDDKDIRILADGLHLGESLICKPASLEILTSSSGLLTIREGKYHQVKRMMKALGGTVTVLERRSMGTVKLPPDLKPGDFRPLTDQEISGLYNNVEMQNPEY